MRWAGAATAHWRLLRCFCGEVRSAAALNGAARAAKATCAVRGAANETQVVGLGRVVAALRSSLERSAAALRQAAREVKGPRCRCARSASKSAHRRRDEQACAQGWQVATACALNLALKWACRLVGSCVRAPAPRRDKCEQMFFIRGRRAANETQQRSCR